MITGIDHIGIASADLDGIAGIYAKIFSESHIHREEIPDQGVRVAGYRVGDLDMEFLQPMRADSPISKFLEKNGNGVHHIALRSDCIEKDLLLLKEKGFRLIDETPKKGAGGKKIAFLHPRSTGGILIELCQRQEEKRC